MGKHISDDLYTPCHRIMSSDDDLPVVMDLYVDFDVFSRLVVCVDLHHYHSPGRNCSTAAVVHPDDSRAMARRHGVDHSALPALIAECMEGWSRLINPSLTQVRHCFKEMTERLLDEHCRFHIRRTLGTRSHICC